MRRFRSIGVALLSVMAGLLAGCGGEPDEDILLAAGWTGDGDVALAIGSLRYNQPNVLRVARAAAVSARRPWTRSATAPP